MTGETPWWQDPQWIGIVVAIALALLSFVYTYVQRRSDQKQRLEDIENERAIRAETHDVTWDLHLVPPGDAVFYNLGTNTALDVRAVLHVDGHRFEGKWERVEGGKSAGLHLSTVHRSFEDAVERRKALVAQHQADERERRAKQEEKLAKFKEGGPGAIGALLGTTTVDPTADLQRLRFAAQDTSLCVRVTYQLTWHTELGTAKREGLDRFREFSLPTSQA